MNIYVNIKDEEREFFSLVQDAVVDCILNPELNNKYDVLIMDVNESHVREANAKQIVEMLRDGFTVMHLIGDEWKMAERGGYRERLHLMCGEIRREVMDMVDFVMPDGSRSTWHLIRKEWV